MQTKTAFLVFLGGGLGSLTRYFVGLLSTQYFSTLMPVGTFVSNICACFILGAVIGMADAKHWLSATSKIFWVVGFCGGFSTFSSFSNEALKMLHDGNLLQLSLYVSASIICCLLATAMGLFMIYKI